MDTEHGLEQIAIARRIATNAHAGQKDKNGVDYIEHPRRVAGRLQQLDEQAVAWLHDVVEDTAVTEDDLREQGVDEAIVEAVLLLSRNRGDADDYYPRIAAQPLARSVKLADIADNTDPARAALLDPETRERLAEKYRKARRTLGVEEEQE
jgi:(p)ppGpp synthase/HD superfamily hydrolase